MERARIPGYFPHTEGHPGVDPTRPEVKRPGHSLTNIRSALDGVAAPPGFVGSERTTGFDVFAGYTVLDALIANRDRHEQNWAILTPQLISSQERLAPSYDHASSLGHNLTDTKRQACLRESDQLLAWAQNGTANRFEHVGRPPTLVEHATQAVTLCTPQGAEWWRKQLEDIDLSPVLEPLKMNAVPGMSDPAATFAHNLLDLNLRRLRDAICKHT